MNFGLYILGTPKGIYGQYPDDYTAEIYKELITGVQGSRLIVHRDKYLAHYIYAENLGEERIFGFSVVFNSATIRRPGLWASYCHSVLEELLSVGKYLTYDGDCNVDFAVEEFCDCPEEYERVRIVVGREMSTHPHRYGISANEKPVSCIKEVRCVSMDEDEQTIVSLSEKYSTVILDDKLTLKDGYLNRLIATLKEENLQAQKDIDVLRKELNLRKRQTWAVAIMSFLVIAGMAGAWFAQRYHETTVSQKNEEIQTLNEILSVQKTLVAQKSDSLLLLKVKITSKNRELKAKESTIRKQASQISEKNRRIEDQESQINDLRQTNASLNRKISSYRNDVAKKRKLIENQQSTITRLNGRISELEAELNNASKYRKYR